MPVKIVLYAEDIATGTEIVNHALKMGGALSVYDPNADAPIKANGAAGERSGPVRALRIAEGKPFRGENTVKESAYNDLQKAFGKDEFTLAQAHEALDAADWDDAQLRSAVHGLRKTGHLMPI